MKHSDFRIGESFLTATGEWRVTDIGQRTIVAIQVSGVEPALLSGPPYMVEEVVFDEYDFGGCWMDDHEELLRRVNTLDKSSLIPHEAVQRGMSERLSEASRRYPHKRLLRRNRIRLDGVEARPCGARDANGWEIVYQRTDTWEMLAVHEAEWLRWPLAPLA